MSGNDKIIEEMAARITKLERAARDGGRQGAGGHWISIPHYNQVSPVTVHGQVMGILAIPRALTVRKWVVACHVSTTNNASNFWVVTLSAGGTTMVQVSTVSDTVATWTQHVATSFTLDTADPATHIYLLVTATMSGTPGTLNFAPSSIYFI